MTRKLSLWVVVEIPVGTSIEVAALDAVELATFLGTDVKFEFNGVSCWARPGGDGDKLVTEYHQEISRSGKYLMRMAFS